MTRISLRRIAPGHAIAARPPALPDVSKILNDVRRDGDAAVARYAERFGDPAPRVASAQELSDAYRTLDAGLRRALDGAAQRIERFARAQRGAFSDCTIATPWGRIGHELQPLERAGAYVPAGRYPLPSSLLMAVIPARVAGVASITVASPRLTPVVLAAASIAKADCVVQIGGAQAIAALAYGTESIPPADIIVGPGNAYVAAAKRAVYGVCGIDGVAGPSEVLIVAGGDADPRLVAADLLAQAEHDVDARALLLTDSERLARDVDVELAEQLTALPTREIARIALERNGWCCIVPLERAPEIVNSVAPEHLELHGHSARTLRPALRAYGALFDGSTAAEALGDYGAGPNHVLPTGGTARFSSGLSVLTFMTVRTFQEVDRPDSELLRDSARLARAEGLEAHARALERRSI